MKTKEKYEQLINASPLFSLEKGTSAYTAEANKMIVYLYEYLMLINREKYEDCSLEIVNTAKKCFSAYKKENGNFLNYFNVAMAKEYGRARARAQMEDMRGGIHIQSEDEKNIRKILKYFKSKGIITPNEEQIENVAVILDLDKEYVIEMLKTNVDAVKVSTHTENEDGEEVDLMDMLSDSKMIDKEIIEKENCESLLSKIEESFLECQDRQKKVISDLTTSWICEIVVQLKINLSEYSFVNQQIVKDYIKTAKIPTQKEIADKFGKEQSDISRIAKNFKTKLYEKIKK